MEEWTREGVEVLQLPQKKQRLYLLSGGSNRESIVKIAQNNVYKQTRTFWFISVLLKDNDIQSGQNSLWQAHKDFGFNNKEV